MGVGSLVHSISRKTFPLPFLYYFNVVYLIYHLIFNIYFDVMHVMLYILVRMDILVLRTLSET